MSSDPIRRILWRRCSRTAELFWVRGADTESLPGESGTLEPSLRFGREIRARRWNSARTCSRRDRGPDGYPLGAHQHLYLTGSYRSQEVRLKVPPLIEQGVPLATYANAHKDEIDPSKQDLDLVALLIETASGEQYLRGALESALPAELQAWIASANTDGRELSRGIALDPQETEVLHALLDHHNVLLYGPAGTGKTRSMLRVKEAFENGVAQLVFNSADLDHPVTSEESVELPAKRAVKFTTFHPSLTYENFIIGLRPVIDAPAPKTAGASSPNSGGALKFAVEDGTLLKLAEFAKEKDSCALLLVDEFNRGNVADILGELITVLEVDKRLDSAGKRTQMTVDVTLPVKPERGPREFSMPFGFYMLASMNPLDRSVAPLDSALRRRFRQIGVPPRLSVVVDALLHDEQQLKTVIEPSKPTQQEIGSMAVSMMSRVNKLINDFWGPNSARADLLHENEQPRTFDRNRS